MSASQCSAISVPDGSRSETVSCMQYRPQLSGRRKNDDVAIIRNENSVELNLIFNANAGDPTANVLMDAPEKYPGYTHMALRVASIPATIAAPKGERHRDNPRSRQLR